MPSINNKGYTKRIVNMKVDMDFKAEIKSIASRNGKTIQAFTRELGKDKSLMEKTIDSMKQKRKGGFRFDF